MFCAGGTGPAAAPEWEKMFLQHCNISKWVNKIFNVPGLLNMTDT